MKDLTLRVKNVAEIYHRPVNQLKVEEELAGLNDQHLGLINNTVVHYRKNA